MSRQSNSTTAQRNAKRHAWNGSRKRLPGVPDGTGCAHVFVIPTQPEPPLGKCRLCGLERMHTNTGDGPETESPWRAWNSGHGPANPERARFKLPTGYHLTGRAE